MPPNDTVMAATLTDVQEAIEQLAVRRDQDTDAARSFSFASTRDPETETDEEAGDDADGQGWHKDARKALAERAEKENARKLREEEEEANGYPHPSTRQSLSAPPISVELSDESDADDEDEAALRNRHHDIHPHHHKYTSSSGTARMPEISLNDPPEVEALQPAITLPTPNIAHRTSQSSLPTPTSPSSPHENGAEITVVDTPAIAQPKPQTPTTATTARFHPSIVPPSHLANVTASLPSPATSSTGGAGLAMNVPLPKSPSPVVMNGNGVVASPPAPPPPQPLPQNISQTVQAPITHADPLTPPQTSDLAGSGSTADSVRESLRRTHPSEWSIEQVVEWLKSKNVDDATCSKFIGESPCYARIQNLTMIVFDPGHQSTKLPETYSLSLTSIFSRKSSILLLLVNACVSQTRLSNSAVQLHFHPTLLRLHSTMALQVSCLHQEWVMHIAMKLRALLRAKRGVRAYWLHRVRRCVGLL